MRRWVGERHHPRGRGDELCTASGARRRCPARPPGTGETACTFSDHLLTGARSSRRSGERRAPPSPRPPCGRVAPHRTRWGRPGTHRRADNRRSRRASVDTAMRTARRHARGVGARNAAHVTRPADIRGAVRRATVAPSDTVRVARSRLGEWPEGSGLAERAVWPVAVVKSVRGAVPVFRPARFPGPLPEPAVRLSPQRALHKPQVSLPDPLVQLGLGLQYPSSAG
jgi:hypothetical protein